MPEQEPLAENLFTWPSEQPALIGGKCSACALVTFPYQRYCSRCDSPEELGRMELPRRGRLWTFTTQQFRPTSPPYAGDDTAESFRPYTLGYVELPGALKVETRLTVEDPAALEIGQEMELKIVPFSTDSEGNQLMMYAFAPVG